MSPSTPDAAECLDLISKRRCTGAAGGLRGLARLSFLVARRPLDALGGGRRAKTRRGSDEKPIILGGQPCGFIPSWAADGSRILCSADSVLYTISAEAGAPEFLGKEYESIAVWSRDIRYI